MNDSMAPVPSWNEARNIPGSATETRWTERWTSWMGHHRDRLIATLAMGLVMVLGAWFWQTRRLWWLRNPWWHLAAIGGWIWVLTGSLIPATLLLAIGLALSFDSYRIFNERFRQTGIRGPR
jgi:hypothetical protein